MRQRRYSHITVDLMRSGQVARWSRFSLTLRHLLVSVVCTFLLSGIEGLFWIFNPQHIFGNSSARGLTDFLSLPFHMPLLFCIPLGELVLIFWLVRFMARPLAVRAYLKRVQLAQEHYRELYTPLQSGSYPYDVPIVYAQDNPDPTLPRQTRVLGVLALIEILLTGSSTHLILLGEPGAGKSMFLHELLTAAAQRRREIAMGQLKVPVFVSLKAYAFQAQTEPSHYSLLDFLLSGDTPGIEYLRPHLGKLFQQGRLLFLCDGLDEVPAAFQQALKQELTRLFRQNRNALLLTCALETYEQSSSLVQIVGENLVPRAAFQPLELADMRSVVERFIGEMDSVYRPDLPTAGQVMTLIGRTRLHLFCNTPLYLFALLEVISTLPFVESRYLDTRGSLLRAFLLKCLQGSAQENEQLPEELVFLGELACAARWNGDDDLLHLPGGTFLAAPLSHSHLRQPTEEEMDAFILWSREQQIVFPFAHETLFLLAEMVEPDEAVSILRRTQDAGLIEIDGHGVLHFRHALIASALLATYLARFLGTTTLHEDAFETFPADLTPWSEPLTLWAGMLERPEEAAEVLAGCAQLYPEQRINALLVSLICLGVAQTQPGVELQRSAPVPPLLAEELGDLLSDQAAQIELATLFMHCARQGSPELYQALFPILGIEGIESWLALLDPAIVSELFFQRLVEIIDEPDQETQVKRLVRALSAWKSAVVPRAASLCSSASGAGGRLRTAAINVLGGTCDRSAVQPLLNCLRDADQIIVRRAANALVRLGPDLTLQSLVQEVEVRPAPSQKKQLHWIILPILERFLNESDLERQPTPEQVERIVAALLHVQSTHTVLADIEKARAILVNHGKLAEERDSGKIAINLLMQNLATADDTVARDMTGALKAVGEVATPQLLEQLESQASEAERVRILEILASVRDLRALDTLLRLIEDGSVAVQQALAGALSVYTPECIPGLINVVLHRNDEQVAARAEQILCGLGAAVVEPVTQALVPVVPERTALLVHSLASARDARAVPALLSLLPGARADTSLLLAIAEALGQCNDERAVEPLLEMLASANPLLSEGAINALSSLGELACPVLLVRLDVPEKTPLVTRIERVLLGMQPFPGERLLQAIERGSDAQLEYIEEIFLAGGVDAAQLLANNLFHPRPRVREQVHQALGQMEARSTVPALLEVLNRPDPDWQALVATFLLKHRREAIPPLVGLLDDPERAEASVEILLQAGQPVLAGLIPALEASGGSAPARASFILVTLVQQQPELLFEAVQLFGLGLPSRACETLTRLLTEELAEVSLPALIAGLEDAHLVNNVVETLVRLAARNSALQASVLEALLQALRVRSSRAGATQALIQLRAVAVTGVGALITADDVQVARVARYILGEIGIPAFPFLWATHSDTSDPDRREAAREVFRAMPTAVIKDELVALLTSARQEEISMALVLLLERIHDEELQPGRTGEMLPTLLEHVQTSADERTSLRVLALLVLLGGPAVSQALIDALYADTRGHERLVQAFLLLGHGAETDLLTVLRDTSAPDQLQAEIAGILAMREPHRDVLERVSRLSEHGLWAGRTTQNMTTVLQPSQLEISLRALGGLLVAGHWDAQELQNRRSGSSQGSPERELYDILLGWRYSPQLTRLRQELDVEREERKRELLLHTEELLSMKAQMIDAEHDLDELQRRHQEEHLDQEQRRKDYEDMITHQKQEKQTLQIELQKIQQEKQALTGRVQQMTQEREKVQAELQKWQTYGQKLEKENLALRRPAPNN